MTPTLAHVDDASKRSSRKIPDLFKGPSMAARPAAMQNARHTADRPGPVVHAPARLVAAGALCTQERPMKHRNPITTRMVCGLAAVAVIGLVFVAPAGAASTRT